MSSLSSSHIAHVDVFKVDKLRTSVALPVMDAFTHQQMIELVSRIVCKKSHLVWHKLWWNSFMAGPLLGFG